MIYSQLRENERTARFEVRVIPGNKCQLVTVESEPAKSSARAKKTAPAGSAGKEWTIAERDEPCWVDLEAEFKRLEQRAAIDLNLKMGETGGAASELLARLKQTLEKLYSGEHIEDYLSYLGLLNIFEYFRLVAALKRMKDSVSNAEQLGIVGEEYFNCRKIALELDLAELTEWLVAHDIGLPSLTLFVPEEYKSEEPVAKVTAAAPKRGRGKKKEEETAAEDQAIVNKLPNALFYTLELIRLHQATTEDLLVFIDDVKTRFGLEAAREAILRMRDDAAPWLDVDHLETQYESMKLEEALATQRSQAAILKQRELFEKKPKRGQKTKAAAKKGLELRLKQQEKLRTPLDELEESIEEDIDTSYERALEKALNKPEGYEFLPDEFIEEPEEAEVEEHGEVEEEHALTAGHEEMNAEHGEQEYQDEYHEDYQEGGYGFEEYPEAEGGVEGEFIPQNGNGSEPHHDARRPRRRRNRKPRERNPRGPYNGPGPRNMGPGPDIRGPHGGHNPPTNRPPKGEFSRPRNQPRGNAQGSQIDFDEMQPLTNDTPGLKPTQPGGAPKQGGSNAPKRPRGGGKRPWRKRR